MQLTHALLLDDEKDPVDAEGDQVQGLRRGSGVGRVRRRRGPATGPGTPDGHVDQRVVRSETQRRRTADVRRGPLLRHTRPGHRHDRHRPAGQRSSQRRESTAVNGCNCLTNLIIVYDHVFNCGRY